MDRSHPFIYALLVELQRFYSTVVEAVTPGGLLELI